MCWIVHRAETLLWNIFCPGAVAVQGCKFVKYAMLLKMLRLEGRLTSTQEKHY
jgi:hypothetical protein